MDRINIPDSSSARLYGIKTARCQGARWSDADAGGVSGRPEIEQELDALRETP